MPVIFQTANAIVESQHSLSHPLCRWHNVKRTRSVIVSVDARSPGVSRIGATPASRPMSYIAVDFCHLTSQNSCWIPIVQATAQWQQAWRVSVKPQLRSGLELCNKYAASPVIHREVIREDMLLPTGSASRGPPASQKRRLY